jgi:hypothetical protein
VERALEREIEHDCERLLLRFYDAFDRGDYAGMAAMFAADGAWHRAGKVLARDQIVPELLRRPADQRVRHVLTNVLVEAQDADRASLRCYLTAYRNPDVNRPPAQQRLRAPWLFLELTARLRRGDGEWSFVEQVVRREFEFVEE